MMAGGPFLAFVAGVLSILSPCVLPILPAVLGAAASERRLGPVVLAGGVALSFTAFGLLAATIGQAVGLNEEAFRHIGAWLIIAVGLVLLLPRLQARFALAGGPVANFADRHFGHVRFGGLAGQLWIGILLGAVWSPCVGPTLGAASLLAAQGRDLFEVAMSMLAFGLGAAIPLVVLGLVSRDLMLSWRDRLRSLGQGMKAGLGVVLVSLGVLVLSGLDRSIEAVLVEASPQWLTDVTTRF
jgi:cytochrome c biogenesis protein CcdA